ncbi:MAG: alcohol dehydrogenase catalytic domain-containing protein [Austwickia sp.]|nr:MAG: alcohol dehydrogenase catalytic domain-containing protein [Austwickia sp.]
MRGVVYDAYGAAPHLAELPEPACPDDGVLLRVAATGVCRSDWHAWQGHDPVPLPMVPGHELVGEIVEVGPEVRRWGPGARVTVPFACGCGRCASCAAGATHVCPHQTQPGFTRWGSFAEYVALEAADTNLVAVPEALGSVAAAALGCRFATAYAALRHATDGDDLAQASGETLVVWGCGGVGLSAVALAAAAGLQVVGVDPAAGARAGAEGLGAAHTLDPTGLDAARLAGAVRDLLGGGAHASIDALGRPELLAAGVLSLRPLGRHAQVGLLLADDAAPSVPMGPVIAGELQIRGVHGLPAVGYPALFAAIGSLGVDLSRLIGRVVGLAQAPAVLAEMSTQAPMPGMSVVDLAWRL